MNTYPNLNPYAYAKSTHPNLKLGRRATLKTAALSLAAAVVIGGGAGIGWGKEIER